VTVYRDRCDGPLVIISAAGPEYVTARRRCLAVEGACSSPTWGRGVDGSGGERGAAAVGTDHL